MPHGGDFAQPRNHARDCGGESMRTLVVVLGAAAAAWVSLYLLVRRPGPVEPPAAEPPAPTPAQGLTPRLEGEFVPVSGRAAESEPSAVSPNSDVGNGSLSSPVELSEGTTQAARLDETHPEPPTPPAGLERQVRTGPQVAAAPQNLGEIVAEAEPAPSPETGPPGGHSPPAQQGDEVSPKSVIEDETYPELPTPPLDLESQAQSESQVAASAQDLGEIRAEAEPAATAEAAASGGDSPPAQPRDDVSPKAVIGIESDRAEAISPDPISPPQESLNKRNGPVTRPPRRGVRVNATEERPMSRPSQPRAEVVCWRRERQWILAVQLPEEFVGDPGLAVIQDPQPLAQDESREGCWHLRRAGGQISVLSVGNDDASEVTVALADENYLQFKLSGDGEDEGRRVKYASYGSYLVVVPESWRRDEEVCGIAPVEPEPVSLFGYRGHFFNLEKGGFNRIAFWTDAGAHRNLDSKAPVFELTGNRLPDAHEKMGPLFGGAPPRIRCALEGGWYDIRTIVVGEEGSGSGKWREEFAPTASSVDQELPAALKAKASGWYFVRLYDCNEDLVESLDFRFATALTAIRFTQPEPFPSEAGHASTTLEFRHDSDCVVEPCERQAAILSVEHQAGGTIAVVPADPAFDRTYWELKPRLRSPVPISVLVERLWWRAGVEHSPPAETGWCDRPLALERDAFKATSDAVLYLRLPKRRWVNEVMVGFTETKRRSCKVRADSRYFSIALREFGDAAEIADKSGDYALKAWINLGIRELTCVMCAVRSEMAPSPVRDGPMREAGAWLATISSAKLAGSLNFLGSQVRGPLRGVIRQLYAARPRGRGRRSGGVTKFKKEALCAIALAYESTRNGAAGALQLPNCRRDQARRAAGAFPHTLERLRRRTRVSRSRRPQT